MAASNQLDEELVGDRTIVMARQESNPNPELHNDPGEKDFRKSALIDAAPQHRASRTTGHRETSGGTERATIPSSLVHLIERWDSLPPHIREAIVTLVDAVP